MEPKANAVIEGPGQKVTVTWAGLAEKDGKWAIAIVTNELGTLVLGAAPEIVELIRNGADQLLSALERSKRLHPPTRT